MSAPALAIAGLIKDYRGLRPLRLEHLVLQAGQHLALLGFDEPAAEMLTMLVTGASVPDAGSVDVLGTSTASLQSSDDWLGLVDHLGIVTDRAVLLDSMSVTQNLALPFTLTIEPPPDDARRRAEALALEVGLPASRWTAAVGDLSGADRVRVRLARAIALDPAVILLEHPTAHVDRSTVAALGHDVRSTIDRRGVAALTLTADEEFAWAAAGTVLRWSPMDGGLQAARRGWFRWRS